MFEKNTKQVNLMIANMFAAGALVVLVLVVCSVAGIFEFGMEYTLILLVAGLAIALSPRILISWVSDSFLKYYMLILAAVFIGVLGTNNHIGVYITYALIPIVSCLYFEPVLVVKTGIFSYIVMIVSVYVNSAHLYEVIYLGRPRWDMFVAYALGFTIEFFIVSATLYLLVKRAKTMMEERYSAEEQNRMKSKFLSSMSHEIRTPMNAIIGMSDVALQKEMSADLRKDISIIKSSSTGLLEVINDILDISKVEAGKLNIIENTYSTESIIEDMKAIINARNNKKLPIYYHIPKNMPKNLKGDAVRIKQVMLNYASNAIKYTDSGRIDVTVACEEAQDGMVNFVYTVKDTGQGIREEDINKLFVMYSQLNQEINHGKEGTGIGLALSKAFIERMNGTVSVKSSYGNGSTFSFCVPQKIVNIQEEEKDGQETIPAFTAPDACILLVDDNEINREVVKAMLEPLELRIDEAENGLIAVNMTKNRKYDLILMDSHMPVMSGEEATKAIREAEMDSHIPVIALTADAISGVREHLISCGMDDYIVKPVQMQELCGVIYKYLPEDKILDEEII